MKSKMPDDDMDYMDWSYKIYQDKKKKERGKPRERQKRENAINIGWRSLRSC